MIQFFRKVRQSIVSSGQFKKYLIYSIGEILLVVLGILIALQINNWNESRKQRNLEIKVLKEMRDNLMSDLDDLKYNIEEDSETLRSNRIILSYIENKWPYHDSISIHYGRLPRSSTLVENVSSYENLKTFGFSLIRNDSLRTGITDLYSERYPYIDEVNLRTSNKLLWDHFNPLLMESLRSIKVLADAVPLDHDAFINNPTIEETIRWHIEIKLFMIDLYKRTVRNINELIVLIEQEIDQS